MFSTGREAICEIPPDRRNTDGFYSSDVNSPGKIYVREGSFLKEPIDRFDASLFDISPHETICMDLQQRLLLKAALEAIEDAGDSPADLAGSNICAYAVSGVPLEDVSYADAHGSGTTVGDTVEADVLGRTFGTKLRDEDSVPVGSVKATIGHLEVAQGWRSNCSTVSRQGSVSTFRCLSWYAAAAFSNLREVCSPT
jgi:acyl transferase domain-containing protein